MPIKKQLQVFIPSKLDPSSFLTKSDRFRPYKLDNIDKLQKYLGSCFNVNFLPLEIVTIGDIKVSELDQSDFVAFLPVESSSLGDEIRKCVELGIPVIFIRHNPEMDCEVINFAEQDNECYKNRPSCDGQRLDHCPGNYSENLVFKELTATIPKIKKFFQLDYIPIFSMSFLIDFLIWYGNYGMVLSENRDKRIKAESEMILSALKGLSSDLGKKISLT